MNKIITLLFLFTTLAVNAQYDNSEKLTILGGFTSTGSEFVFWADNVYGGNVQLLYDVKKIHEGAIGLKASSTFSNGYTGYYGGLNLRIGSRFFGDTDLLFGYSTISNETLLKSYDTDKFTGGAFVGNIGLGYRLANTPLLFRLAFCTHFPFGESALNTSYNIQIGYRIGKQ